MRNGRDNDSFPEAMAMAEDLKQYVKDRVALMIIPVYKKLNELLKN